VNVITVLILSDFLHYINHQTSVPWALTFQRQCVDCQLHKSSSLPTNLYNVSEIFSVSWGQEWRYLAETGYSVSLSIECVSKDFHRGV